MTQAIPQDQPLLPNGRFSTAWQRYFIGLNTAGVGSVTSVSIVPANGISGTVGTATTTPAITLALGNITPTQVASTGPVTGTNLSGTNTGDQTIGLTGDVTGSGVGTFAATIAAKAVSFAKFQDSSGASLLLGRGAGSGAGSFQEIVLGTNLSMTGSTLNAGGGGSGDVVGPASSTNNNVVFFNGTTGKLIKDSGLALSGSNTGDQTITLTGNVTGTGTTSFATTIAAGVVTLAMQANMATASVFYRKTAGAGAPEVQTLATLKTDLGLTGTNSGDQTISIGGDGTAAGGTGALTLAVTKVNGVSFAGLGTGILKNTTGTGVPSIAIAADFPTLNQSTTGSAATLTTPRNINGVAFNGSADITVTVPVATGVSGLAAGVATFLATPSSANMGLMLTDKSGSTGSVVFSLIPDITSPKFLGNVYIQQGAPASLAAAATLTAAQMLGGMIQYTGAAGALTLPTGTLMDASVLASLAVDRAFDVSFIVTGAGAATVTAGVGFTIVGAGLVAAGTSCLFRCRKTAANTYVAYRIG